MAEHAETVGCAVADRIFPSMPVPSSKAEALLIARKFDACIKHSYISQGYVYHAFYFFIERLKASYKNQSAIDLVFQSCESFLPNKYPDEYILIAALKRQVSDITKSIQKAREARAFAYKACVTNDLCLRSLAKDMLCSILRLTTLFHRELSEYEQTQLMDEALELALEIDNYATHRDVVYDYVLVYLRCEGMSSRLLTLLEKCEVRCIEAEGEWGYSAILAKVNTVKYLVHCHRFEEAISRVTPMLDFVATDAGYMIYDAFGAALWGSGRNKEASRVYKKAKKLMKKKGKIYIAKRFEGLEKECLKQKYSMPCPKKAKLRREETVPNETYDLMKNMVHERACEVCQTKTKRLLACARCKLVWYCSKEHQERDWNRHKSICKKC